MIRLDGVSKHFAGTHALEPLSLTFEQAQTHVILGSSGCGKSTLLRIIMGLIPSDTGQVFIDGQRMNPESQPGLAPKMGYVIQEGGLFPHLSARDNVALKARLSGWTRQRINQRTLELSELVELSESMLDRYPRELSGGQRQRVSLMRALMLDPPLLLLDEPLGALDPIVRRSLQMQLKAIFNRLKKTVVLVTHDLGEAAFFGHTITLLDAGKIAQHGSFLELAKNPSSSFVTEFINAQRPVEELRQF